MSSFTTTGAISSCISFSTWAENSSLAMASFTVLKPAKMASPQLMVWVPFNKRSFNSLNLSIDGTMKIPLSALANDKISFTFSLDDSMAQSLKGSAMIISSSS
ncbi:hypothetical protein D3C73_1037190 [compost metagenome]